jgi:hypothetical protein
VTEGTPGLGSTLFATGLPPGWIEIGAFRDEATLRGFLEEQLSVDRDLFDADQRAMVVDACSLAHALVRPQQWLHLGAVVTYVPGQGGDWRTTVWTIGVGLLRTPDIGDIDPLAVAERVLGSVSGVEVCESFQLDDGRRGVVLGLLVSVDPDTLGGAPVRQLPQLDLQALGGYACLLPVPGLPGHVGVTIGVAPNREERGPMSVLAAQMATSLRVLADPAELPSEQVLVDVTRSVHESGFLKASSDSPVESEEGQ